MKQLEKTYKAGDKEYVYDPDLLSFYYKKFISLDDKEFLDKIPDALHFACYVCWLKEIESENCLADNGIIHELVHLLKPNDYILKDLPVIRKKFKEILII